MIRYCLRNRAKGRFYVGSTRRGTIEFVASTARRHGTRKYKPGKRVRREPHRRRRAAIARGVFMGTGKRQPRDLRRAQAQGHLRRHRQPDARRASRRALVKRLRALQPDPRSKR